MLIKYDLPPEWAAVITGSRLGSTFARAAAIYTLARGFNVTDDGYLYDRNLKLYDPETGKVAQLDEFEPKATRTIGLEWSVAADTAMELPRRQKFWLELNKPIELSLRGRWFIGTHYRPLTGHYGLVLHPQGHHILVWKNPVADFSRPAHGDDFFIVPRSRGQLLIHDPPPTDPFGTPALRWAYAGQMTVRTIPEQFIAGKVEPPNPNVFRPSR